MILTVEDLMPEMVKLFPHFTEASIRAICSKGMTSTNKFLRLDYTVINTLSGDELVVFTRKVPPELQEEFSIKNYFRSKKYKKRVDL